MRALLSVHDKAGLPELARGLQELGWELVASGKTGAALHEEGISHHEVAEVTGAPEMLDGRVKTLHPRIHAAILADRANSAHVQQLHAQEIVPIDLVVANLYPFEREPSVEMIDIGGPAMVRAAAKNWAHVAVVVDPADYGPLLRELRDAGSLSEATRLRLARRAFAHTAAYDAAIAAWLEGLQGVGEGTGSLPPVLSLTLERAEKLHYGENPHQAGARYRIAGATSWWDGATKHAGRALSYLNLFDTDAAWRLVHELASDAGEHSVAIVKHANPCGAAIAGGLRAAFERALEGDPLSAFGGIVALSGPVTADVAAAISAGPQFDVIVAPSFESDALARLSERRKATRLLSAPPPEPLARQVRTLGASALVQDPDVVSMEPGRWRVVTKVEPDPPAWRDLRLAWRVCAMTTSNAVVVVAGGSTVGVGAGQQSRVMAAELAARKAGDRAAGGVAASDAFFPFPDGLEVLASAGVRAVVQPGGSVRDSEVIEAADRAGVSMVMTGERHFRH